MNDEILMEFKKLLSKIEYLKYTLNSLLYWDKITYMPQNAIEYRNEVMSYIGETLHELLSSEELQYYVRYYDGNKTDNKLINATIRNICQIQQPITDIPENEYIDYIRLLGASEKIWNESRAENQYEKIRPYFEQIFNNFRNFSEYWGYTNEPYDALIKYYVEGYTVQDMDNMVEGLKQPLLNILEQRLEIQKNLHCQRTLKGISKEKQLRLWELILKEIGFDFNAGRVDIGSYTTILANSPDDVRIVAEFSENDFLVGVFNILHSGGKAIYHQNIDKSLLGTLLAEPPSFVMEEAIGRFYENIIGRSKGFWERIFPKAREFIPELKEIDIEDFYQMINYCEPSCIRMNADEITFLIHIIIRYEIEKGIFRGDYEVCDLEDIWKFKYKEYLNVEPQNVKEGVLQDIHWAAGYIGYFPTYILSNIAAAQFAYAIKSEGKDIEQLIIEGGIEKINQWMYKNIFKWGAVYDFHELIKNVCNEDLNVNYYLSYLREKFLKQILN